MPNPSKPEEQTPQNFLSVLSVLHSADILKRETSYLPRFSIFYPIQNSSGEGKPWHAYLGSGIEEENQFLSIPYFLTMLGVRNAVRTKKAEEMGYVRSFADPKSVQGKARLEEIQKSETKEVGYVVLLAVLIPETTTQEEAVCIATCELYKTHTAYWSDCFASSELRDRKLAKINLANHSKNLVKSKSGMKYLSKFEPVADWEVKEIEKKELEAVLGAIQASKEKIESFINE